MKSRNLVVVFTLFITLLLPSFAFATGLTPTQIQAVLSLLAAFGADQSTVNNVQASLTGSPTTVVSGSAPATLTVVFLNDLTFGSSGDDVRQLQQFLIAKGYLVMPVGGTMGYFGVATKAAVIQWQSASGINPATGFVGPKSRAVLNGTTPVYSVVAPTTSLPSPAAISLNTSSALKPSMSVADISQMVRPRAVLINARDGSGSGFLYSNTIVVTNAHVVKDIYRVGLHINGAATTTGYVAGVDEANDIAIISIEPTTISSLSFGDSGEVGLKQGDPVYAFGFPFGLPGDPSVTTGTLSRRLTQNGTPYLEISNDIHPGNSGGPVLNSRGEVVGVVTKVYGNGDGSGDIVGETVKFAIPGNDAKKYASVLVSHIVPMTPERQKRIDDYENFMTELDGTYADYNKALSDYDSIMKDNPPNPAYLRYLGENQLDNVLGRAKRLFLNIPSLVLKNNMTDTLHSLQLLAEDGQGLIQHEVVRYAESLNGPDARSAWVASDKVNIDKRWETNKQKAATYKLFYDMVTASAMTTLRY